MKAQEYRVFFSSYEISDGSFFKEKVKDVQVLMNTCSNKKKTTEYLYSNERFQD